MSGHDMHDIEIILEATKGTGVNVYTHGEMLPAHGYPKLKEYPVSKSMASFTKMRPLLYMLNSIIFIVATMHVERKLLNSNHRDNLVDLFIILK